MEPKELGPSFFFRLCVPTLTLCSGLCRVCPPRPSALTSETLVLQNALPGLVEELMLNAAHRS